MRYLPVHLPLNSDTLQVIALLFLGVALGYAFRKLRERRRYNRITRAAMMRLGPAKWRP